MTGGGGPPRVPVKVCTLFPAAAAAGALDEAATCVTAEGARHALTRVDCAAAAGAVVATSLAAVAVATAWAFAVENVFKSTRSEAWIPPVPVNVWATAAAAEATSSWLASRTSLPVVKMQPSLGSGSSHELPLAVASLSCVR
jgi:hypothetical protein